jgi:hypothetical protein
LNDNLFDGNLISKNMSGQPEISAMQDTELFRFYSDFFDISATVSTWLERTE